MIRELTADEGLLSDGDVTELVLAAIADQEVDGKRVLAIVPDSTRTAPVGLVFKALTRGLLGRAAKLDVLVALGTHPPMSDDKINDRLEITAEERAGVYADVGIHNHRWGLPETFAEIGRISAEEVEELSGGLLSEEVPVSLNRMVLDHDLLIIVGPTFPHEVVGFSGGNKYFFPGIAQSEIIDFTHWLGALITNVDINGTKDTPVRRVIDRAASFIPTPRIAIDMVATKEGLKGVFIGPPEEAFSAAADLSAQVHVVYKDRTYSKVLSCPPEMYDDIWTAAKAMYKLEPVLADGAELIIYAPHIDEVSYSHHVFLDEIGYHVRDYFLSQPERFAGIPRGVIAHSTHVKGAGTYVDGVEIPRVEVVLATGISEERCRRINLGYRDPATIDPADWAGREDEGLLLVENAGEYLFRLKG